MKKKLFPVNLAGQTIAGNLLRLTGGNIHDIDTSIGVQNAKEKNTSKMNYIYSSLKVTGIIQALFYLTNNGHRAIRDADTL